MAKENSFTIIGTLPNELFSEIFSYLNGVDVFFAFSHLNHRFECLINEYCQFFDFKSISKYAFDLIYQYHNTKRWKSLRLSNDEHTPDLLEYFCQFYSLITDFPQLQSLSILKMDSQKTYTILSQLSSLTNLVSLTIKSICCQKMSQFDLPNLKRLVFGCCINIDLIIRSSLPLLKIFKFYFYFYIQYSSHLPNPIDEMISSFSTSFYVVKNKWFVRCDIPHRRPYEAMLYSLPFPFHSYRAFQGPIGKSISTELEDKSTNVFENIKTLVIYYKTAEPDKDFIKSGVINLTVNGDLDLFKWIHLFTKLRHLEFNPYVRISSQNLFSLLKNTPHLYSLTVEKGGLQRATEDWSNASICNYLSQKIRSLKLSGSRSISNNEIQHIIRIFLLNWQHLSLWLQSPHDKIPSIIQNMSRLHSLHVSHYEKLSPSIDITWLEKQQTKYNRSNCMIVNNGNDHSFWLGNHL